MRFFLFLSFFLSFSINLFSQQANKELNIICGNFSNNIIIDKYNLSVYIENSNVKTHKVDIINVKMKYYLLDLILNEEQYILFRNNLNSIGKDFYSLNPNAYARAEIDPIDTSNIKVLHIYLNLIFKNIYVGKNNIRYNEYNFLNKIINEKINVNNVKKKWSFNKGRYIEITQ